MEILMEKVIGDKKIRPEGRSAGWYDCTGSGCGAVSDSGEINFTGYSLAFTDTIGTSYCTGGRLYND